MNKSTLLFLLILTLILTACSGGAANAAGPGSSTQSGPAAGELSTSMQVAIGTLKLDETENAVTAEQAAELLPLWQTLNVLYNSDTAATEEIDALITQIGETMTDKQTAAILAMNLTRQDMMSVMQSQGMALGSAQSGNTRSGNSTTGNGGNFGPGGGFAGGPPPDGGGFPDGAPNFQGQGTRSQSSDTTDNTNLPTVNLNRIPTPLVQAVIDYLKEKAGS
jgi:hypothetical protein